MQELCVQQAGNIPISSNTCFFHKIPTHSVLPATAQSHLMTNPPGLISLASVLEAERVIILVLYYLRNQLYFHVCADIQSSPPRISSSAALPASKLKTILTATSYSESSQRQDYWRLRSGQPVFVFVSWPFFITCSYSLWLWLGFLPKSDTGMLPVHQVQYYSHQALESEMLVAVCNQIPLPKMRLVMIHLPITLSLIVFRLRDMGSCSVLLYKYKDYRQTYKFSIVTIQIY